MKRSGTGGREHMASVALSFNVFWGGDIIDEHILETGNCS